MLHVKSGCSCCFHFLQIFALRVAKWEYISATLAWERVEWNKAATELRSFSMCVCLCVQACVHARQIWIIMFQWALGSVQLQVIKYPILWAATMAITSPHLPSSSSLSPSPPLPSFSLWAESGTEDLTHKIRVSVCDIIADVHSVVQVRPRQERKKLYLLRWNKTKQKKMFNVYERTSMKWLFGCCEPPSGLAWLGK